MVAVADIDAILPQTQCKDCGYAGCLPYAQALSQGLASIDKCPPGGLAVLEQLGALLQVDTAPYRQAVLRTTRQPLLAVIQEEDCIGCTKCIPACPVDAIIGSSQKMHAVLSHECTGCGLCVAPCPVDCITMVPTREITFDKGIARDRHQAKQLRTLKAAQAKEKAYREKRQLASQTADKVQELHAKQQYIQHALARVKAKKHHE